MNTVRIAVNTFKLRASWVHSLKEKENDSKKPHFKATKSVSCFGS